MKKSLKYSLIHFKPLNYKRNEKTPQVLVR